MSFHVPKISMSWAISSVAACFFAGGVGLVFLTPSAPVHQASLVLVDFPEVSVDFKTDSQADSQADSQHVKFPEGPLSQEDKTLEEKTIIPHAPLVLPETTSEHAEKMQAITLSVADLTQDKKDIVPVAEVSVNVTTTPYYNAACVENRGKEMFLPIESPEGLRPFDVYQGDYLPDSTKTQLTLVISELGPDPALFEQVKSSFPKEVVCSFLAIKSLSQKMNNEARELGHETLLMLPLEPMNYPKSDPGSWTLLTNLSVSDNKKRLEHHLSQFTGYIAVTPYMGNRFSRVKHDFQPILKELKRRGLGYFEPRLVRSKAVQWKDAEMPYAKGHYDISRGMSAAKTQEILDRVQADLQTKQSVILTVQADRVSLQKVQKWLPKVLTQTTVLVPLSAVTE